MLFPSNKTTFHTNNETTNHVDESTALLDRSAWAFRSGEDRIRQIVQSFDQMTGGAMEEQRGEKTRVLFNVVAAISTDDTHAQQYSKFREISIWL